MRELINAHIEEARLGRTATVFAGRKHKLGFGKAPLSSGHDPSPSAGSDEPIQSLSVNTIPNLAAPLLAPTTPQTVAATASVPPPQLSDALSSVLLADRSTTATAGTGSVAQSMTQISNVRNDITLSSPEVGTSNIKTQPSLIVSANGGVILEQSAQREATEPSAFAKNETERLIRTDAEAQATDDTSSGQPRERIAESPRVVVILLLSLGLPGVSILGWLIIKPDSARGERLVDHLDEHSQADWIDDFLANWRQSLTRPNPVFESARKSEAAA